MPDGKSKFDALQAMLGFMAGRKLGDVSDSSDEDEYTVDPDDEETVQLAELINMDHKKMFKQIFALVGKYTENKSHFDEHNLPIGQDIEDCASKVQIAVDNAESCLKDLTKLGLDNFDTQNLVKSMQRLKVRKIDFVELEKNKTLSLCNNFKIQQTNVLEQLTLAHSTLGVDMLIPYRPKERLVEVIKSTRQDAARDFTWKTGSKNGIS